MAADRNDSDSAHEVRLEGVGLLLGGGFLLALVVGAFFLGRWVERQAHPPLDLAQVESGRLAQVGVEQQPDADAAEGLTVFDTVEQGEAAAEPGREVRSPEPAPRQADEPPPSALPAGGVGADDDGGFYVQVLALRDRSAAAEVIRGLERKGYNVRLFTEREGQSVLYKVRVGSYASRELAGAARDELRNGGHPGAFVWPTG